MQKRKKENSFRAGSKFQISMNSFRFIFITKKWTFFFSGRRKGSSKILLDRETVQLNRKEKKNRDIIM